MKVAGGAAYCHMSERLTAKPSAPSTRASARDCAFGRSLAHVFERTRLTAAFRST
jgi:hypothetical protein